MGADTVAQVLSRIASTASLRSAEVNGAPALIVRLEGSVNVNTVMALRMDDRLISGIYAVRNPDKLSHLERETGLRR